MNGIILENQFVEKLTAQFKKSGKQMNDLNECDCEIVKINENINLAFTTDSISEEILSGLYTDPYQIGWMIVMVNLSDIAATGAEPLGLLISEILPNDLDDIFINQMQKGISDAADACGTFILGGDTNSGKYLVLSGCAAGLITNNSFMKRSGCKLNDLLYTSGKAGRGNLFALQKFKSKKVSDYYPRARITESKIIKKYCSCCIDTSDGLLAGIDQLMRVNHKGYFIESKVADYIDLSVIQGASRFAVDPWLMAAGIHGDYELLFTINKDKEIAFLSEAISAGLNPIKLGKVIKEEEIYLNINNKKTRIDSAYLRNLLIEKKNNLEEYIKSLLDYEYTLL